jgi:hypothetical protein
VASANAAHTSSAANTSWAMGLTVCLTASPALPFSANTIANPDAMPVSIAPSQ